MRLFFPLVAALLAAISFPATAMTMEQAQAIVNGLQRDAKATEIREFHRDKKIVYEIEYLFNGEEYETIVTADGTILENYKDTGAKGPQLPVIVSLALSQDSDLYKDQDEDLELIPVIIGSYGNFWFKGLRHGYSLYSRDRFTFSPMIKINPDYGYQAKDADKSSRLYVGLEDTEVTVEAGTQFLFDFPALQLELNLLGDISGGHKGTLIELAFSKPQHLGSLLFIPSLTFTYNDNKVTNYYFGVKRRQATALRPAFSLDSSLDSEVSATMIWNISESWYLVGDLSYKFYDDKLKDSPLVDSVDQASGFFGVGYSF